MENQDPNKGQGIPRWKPQLWMKFNTVAEAWEFWEYYGGRMGFSVRKRYTNTSKIDGVVTGCKFVCFKEGTKGVDKRDSLTKKGQAEIRTGCKVHMSITVDREDGSYQIFDLDVEHNHMLQLPEAPTAHKKEKENMPTQTDSVENAASQNSAPNEQASAKYEFMGSFTDLLTTPVVAQDLDDDIFRL